MVPKFDSNQAESNGPSVKIRHFLTKFDTNWSKYVQKLQIFKLVPKFDWNETESNDPAVKIPNFPTRFAQFPIHSTKSATTTRYPPVGITVLPLIPSISHYFNLIISTNQPDSWTSGSVTWKMIDNQLNNQLVTQSRRIGSGCHNKAAVATHFGKHPKNSQGPSDFSLTRTKKKTKNGRHLRPLLHE